MRGSLNEAEELLQMETEQAKRKREETSALTAFLEVASISI